MIILKETMGRLAVLIFHMVLALVERQVRREPRLNSMEDHIFCPSLNRPEIEG